MPIQNIVRVETHNNRVIELMQVEEEYLIDSRIVAKGLDIQHESFKETIAKYQERIEHFGQLRLVAGVVNGHNGGGNPEKYFLLNRYQIFFLITLSKNTPEVLDWKEAIIDALAQLEKQVRMLKSPRPKQIAPTKREQKTLQEEQQLDEYLQSEIIRMMTRLTGNGHEWITASVLYSYLKKSSRHEIQIRMQTLTSGGTLEEERTARALRYRLK